MMIVLGLGRRVLLVDTFIYVSDHSRRDAVQKVSANWSQRPFYDKKTTGKRSRVLCFPISRSSVCACVLAKIADQEEVSDNPLAVSANEVVICFG